MLGLGTKTGKRVVTTCTKEEYAGIYAECVKQRQSMAVIKGKEGYIVGNAVEGSEDEVVVEGELTMALEIQLRPK
jgi:hypothetical protein